MPDLTNDSELGERGRLRRAYIVGIVVGILVALIMFGAHLSHDDRIADELRALRRQLDVRSCPR